MNWQQSSNTGVLVHPCGQSNSRLVTPPRMDSVAYEKKHEKQETLRKSVNNDTALIIHNEIATQIHCSIR